jgi:hypothetical protein
LSRRIMLHIRYVWFCRDIFNMFSGLSWIIMGVSGYFWIFLDIVWMFLDLYDVYVWIFLDLSGYCLDVSGCLCIIMDMFLYFHGYFWIFLAIMYVSSGFWTYLDFVWMFMACVPVISGCFWICLDLFWIFLDCRRVYGRITTLSLYLHDLLLQKHDCAANQSNIYHLS